MSSLESSNPASLPRATRVPRATVVERPPLPAPESGAGGIPPVLTAAPTFGALLPIKLSADDPKEARILLNALLDTYLQVVREEREAQHTALKNPLRLDETALVGLPSGDVRQIDQIADNLARVRVNARQAIAEL